MHFEEVSLGSHIASQRPRICKQEAQTPCCLKSSVTFPKSMMIWGVTSTAGVGLLCSLKFIIKIVFYQDISEHIRVPAANRLRCKFNFPARLGTCSNIQRYQKQFSDHGDTVLDWPKNLADLHLRGIHGYCQAEDDRHQT